MAGVSHIQTYQSETSPDQPVWIGIDQSLTGFAICVLDKEDNYSIAVLHPTNKGAARLQDIYVYLDAAVATWNPEDIAMEGTVVHSASASVLGELSGVVKLCLNKGGYTPLIVPPLTLKKFVIGNAKSAQKSHMLLQTYKRYGVELPDDNAADAYGLARIVRGQTISVAEEQILTKLAHPKFRE